MKINVKKGINLKKNKTFETLNSLEPNFDIDIVKNDGVQEEHDII